jgi:DNA adenine methylase
MIYMGGKYRIAKYIMPVILQDRAPDQWYIEPFVGGFNSMVQVSGPLRWANDNHYYLIRFFRALQAGWQPPKDLSEEMYREIRNSPQDFEPELVGYIGFFDSYSGKWLGGFARDNNIGRNYRIESYKWSLKFAVQLPGVKITCLDYRQIKLPPKSLLYCDPPYAGTTKYTSDFDSLAFWVWCDEQVDAGHTVFVSEYEAPSGWEVVWQKSRATSLTSLDSGAKQDTEKLFRFRKR